ncbi:MAG: hypothetical protein AAFO94_00225, partial [Bacteroidota bacterium]
SGTLTVERTAPNSLYDGVTAVADYDLDGDLDGIIGSTDSLGTYVYIWDLQTQTQIGATHTVSNQNIDEVWYRSISVPVVADFDGDQKPEIGMVSNYVFQLVEDYTYDISGLGGVRWDLNTTDNSGMTGLAAFDFNGDDIVEVVYRDEDNLRIVSGITGLNLSTYDCGARTATEYPLVIDIDNDGETEIVCNCSSVTYSAISAVTAFKSKDYPWVPSREVWNQYQYSVTNINDDLSVPKQQQAHHKVGSPAAGISGNLNTFIKQIGPVDENGNTVYPAPDLDVEIVSYTAGSCGSTQEVQIELKFTNSGDINFPSNIPFAIYAGDPEVTAANLIGLDSLSAVVETNNFELHSTTIDLTGVSLPANIYIVGNDNGTLTPPFNIADEFTITTVGECSFFNNKSQLSLPDVCTLFNDDAVPTFNAPADLTVSCDNVPTYTAADANAEDACSGLASVTLNTQTSAGSCSESYTITNTWTATDACGNSATTAQVITVQDNTAPVFDFLPADTVLNCGDSFNSVMATAIDDCDNNVSVTVVESTCLSEYPNYIEEADGSITIVPDSPDPGFSYSRPYSSPSLEAVCTEDPFIINRWKVTNNNTYDMYFWWEIGTQSGSFIAPPGDFYFFTEPEGSDPITVNYENRRGRARSMEAYPTLDICELPGAITCGCSYKRTFTATDNCNNSITAVQTITVVDTIPPILTNVPADVTAECDAIPAAPNVTATAACGGNLVVDYEEIYLQNGSYVLDVSGNLNASGNYWNWDVTDQDDLSAGDFASMELEFTTNKGKGRTEFALIAPSGDAIVLIGNNCVGGDCEDAGTFNPVFFACYSAFAKWNNEDDIPTGPGNFTPHGGTLPNVNGATNWVDCFEDLSGPMNGTWTLYGLKNQTVNGSIQFGGSEHIIADHACLDPGYILRKWSAEDDCGNKITATQLITLEDTTPPVFDNVPADTTVACDDVPVAPTVSATDNCDPGPIQVDLEEVSGSGCDYTITRTWTATDTCGNTATATQTITVNQEVGLSFDAQPDNLSDISCGDDLPTQETLTATDGCGAVATVEASVDSYTPDACDGYTITYRWRATDVCNNTLEVTRSFDVLPDDESPSFQSFPDDVTVDCNSIPAVVTPTATDNCSTDISLSLNTVTGSGCNYAILREWTATDECNNAFTRTQTITVESTTAPTFDTTPDDIDDINCDAALPAQEDLTATDECGNAISVSKQVINDDATACGNYEIIYQWTATDACGLSTTITRGFTVLPDVTAPVFDEAPDAIANIACDDDLPLQETLTATDDCGGSVTIEPVVDPYVEDQCNGYIITYRWTATDACGNSSSTSVSFSVLPDAEAPVFDDSPDAIANINCGDALPIPQNITATDACQGLVPVSLAIDTLSGDACAGYTVQYQWTATDDCGFSESVSTTFAILSDAGDPTFDKQPDPIADIRCLDDLPTPETLTASNNCSGTAAVDFQIDSYTVDTCGGYTITYRWLATDLCGRTSEVSTSFDVLPDNTGPTFDVFPDDTTVDCYNIPAPVQPTVSDDCGHGVALSLNTNSGSGCNYNITYTWTATDRCGNESTRTQTITVEDREGPVFDSTPSPLADINCGDPFPTQESLTATDCQGAVIVVPSIDPFPASSCESYTVTYRWTVEDGCGNSTEVTQSFNVLADDSSPVFDSLPDPLADIRCGDPLPLQETLTASDLCGIKTGSIDLIDSIPLANANNTDYIWGENDCNVDQGSQTLSLDLPADIGECYTNLIIEMGMASDGNLDYSGGGAVADWVDVNVIVNGVSEHVENANPDYCLSNAYDVTKTLGGESSCNCDWGQLSLHCSGIWNDCSAGSQPFVLVVSKMVVPSDDVQLEFNYRVTNSGAGTCEDACDERVQVNYVRIKGVWGSCSNTEVTPSVDPYTEDRCNGYDITYRWTATDDCGNTSEVTQSFSVLPDDTAPTFDESPAAIADINCGEPLPVQQDLSASDDCGGAVIVTKEIEDYAEDLCGGYQVTYRWVATDACDNSTSVTQSFNVRPLNNMPTFDESPATIADINCGDDLPTPQTLIATDACGNALTAVHSIDTYTVDTCGGYTITYRWRATDACSNTNEVTASFEVLPDVTAPSFTSATPDDVTVSCDDIPAPATMNAMDGCGTATVSYNQQKVDGDCIDTHELHREWTATDQCGRTTTVTQVITVRNCAPTVDARIDPATTICEAEAMTIWADLGSGYDSPVYQWQFSSDNGSTWTSMPGATNVSLDTVATSGLEGSYRVVVANDVSDLFSPYCSIVSEKVDFTVMMKTAVTNETAELCEGDLFEGVAYLRDTLLIDTFPDVNGCDSIVHTQLIIHPVYDLSADVEICAGETYRGVVYNNDFTLVENLQSVEACDSTFTTNITVHPVYDTTITPAICEGDLYEGTVYTSSTTFVKYLTTIQGCDSTVRVELTVDDVIEVTLNIPLCEGASYNGVVYTADVTLSETVASASGCDSTTMTVITVAPVYDVALDTAICQGETYRGYTPTQDTTIVELLQSISGCDSTVTTDLTVYPMYTLNLEADLCAGDTFEGNSYTADTVLTKILSTVNGCDSIISTSLRVRPVYEETIPETVCYGEVYKGFTITQDTLIREAYTSVYGCDSIELFPVTVLPVYSATESHRICAGEAFMGYVPAQDTTIISALQSVNGCDSTIQYNVSLLPVYQQIVETDICFGESHKGYTPTQDTVLIENLQTTDGCDSIVTTNVTVHPLYSDSIHYDLCAGFRYQGEVYLKDSIITEVLTSVNGCDSTVRTYIDVHPHYEMNWDT